MTEPESTCSEMEERSANVSDVDMNTVCYFELHQLIRISRCADPINSFLFVMIFNRSKGSDVFCYDPPSHVV